MADPSGGVRLDGEDPSRLGGPARLRSWWTRRRTQEKLPLGAALRRATLRDPDRTREEDEEHSVEELEAIVRTANDKERLIGLFAAPWAAAIALIITNALIANDPVAKLSDGKANPLHVSVGLYHEVLVALMVLALLMLGFAWFRKRLQLGIVLALYGITVFNLRYWGFGIPFAIAGAWYLVRAYRFNRRLREARGDVPRYGNRSSRTSRPQANKRYTPPVTRSR